MLVSISQALLASVAFSPSTVFAREYLRSGLKEPSQATTTLLAHVDVTPGATVDMYESDGIVIIQSHADEENADTLLSALSDASAEEGNHDFIGFYKKLSGSQDVPAPLMDLVTNRTNTTALVNATEPSPWNSTLKFGFVNESSSNSSSLKFEAVDGSFQYDMVNNSIDDNGQRRRLDFCDGLSYACKSQCYTSLTGLKVGNVVRNNDVYSYVHAVQGTVQHRILVWPDWGPSPRKWVEFSSDWVKPGETSRLGAYTRDGRDLEFMVRVGESMGYNRDFYNLRYC